MKTPPTSSPLSNAVTYILLALANRDLHGYGIMSEISALSGGDYKVGPGTLYDNLRTLMAAGLVAEFSESGVSHEPRRMYRLSEAGAGVLEAELKRLQVVVQAGRQRLRAPKAREAP